MSNSKTNMKSNWYDYDEGFSIGTVGADGGAIVRDEEHETGARITLEEEGSSASFVVTCGIYGWMFHTRYFPSETEAAENFEMMRDDLEKILESLPAEDESDEETRGEFSAELESFVERFP